jgi:hypothetical protein
MTAQDNTAYTIILDPPTPEEVTAARALLASHGLTEDWRIVHLAIYGTADNPRPLMKAAGQAVLAMTCYSCKTRKLDPSDKDATALELCRPCLTEAELDNEHSDGYHDQPVEGCARCADPEAKFSKWDLR